MKRSLTCIAILTAAILTVGSTTVPRTAQAADPTVDPAGSAVRIENCRIKPAVQITLSANQSGAITSVPQEGDHVESGQQILRLDDELARAAFAVAEKQAANDVDIRFAGMSSEVARLEHEQAMEVNLSLKGSIPITEVRRRKLEFDRSVLQIEKSKHEQAIAVLKQHEAAALLKTYSVAAPFEGTVAKVLKRQGEAVRQGEPVLELVDTRRVRVEGYIDVAHRLRITPGTPVLVERELIGDEPTPEPATGKIVFVDTVVQPVTRQIRVWADVDNSHGSLVSGLTATMTVVPGAAATTTTR